MKALLVTFALALASCVAPPGGAADRPGAGLRAEGPGLTVRLRADRSQYPPGTPVELTLIVDNTGVAPVTVTARSSQLYDFAVLRDGQEVWRWAADKLFMAVLTDWTLAPGGRREFSERWDQRTQEGAPVGPGRYAVVGTVMGGERVGLRPVRLDITIR